MIENGRMPRTIVLHPGALGDVFLAVPALRALRARAPGDELGLAAQPRIGALLASLGIVDRHVTFDALGLDTLFTDDAPSPRLGELVAGARVVSWFGAGSPDFARRLRALAPGAVLCSTASPQGTMVWRHLLASVLSLLPATAAEDSCCDPMDIAPAIVAEGRRVLDAVGWTGERPLVMLHPGAGGASKRWPTEGFVAVAEALVDSHGADLVVHDGPADHDAVGALRARLHVPVLALTDPPLEALAGALRHVALWIGNDSGVSHLAAAVGAPALVLFNEANLAWRPWSREARTLVVSTHTLARADVDAMLAEATAMLEAQRPAGARRVR